MIPVVVARKTAAHRRTRSTSSLSRRRSSSALRCSGRWSSTSPVNRCCWSWSPASYLVGALLCLLLPKYNPRIRSARTSEAGGAAEPPARRAARCAQRSASSPTASRFIRQHKHDLLAADLPRPDRLADRRAGRARAGLRDAGARPVGARLRGRRAAARCRPGDGHPRPQRVRQAFHPPARHRGRSDRAWACRCWRCPSPSH